MEATAAAAGRFGGEYYDWRTSSSVEWDPNHWKWDGDLFIATPVSAAAAAVNNTTTTTATAAMAGKQFFPLSTTTTVNGVSSKSNSESSCSEELLIRADNGVRELEKKRRANTIEGNSNENRNRSNNNNNSSSSNLSLNLGGGEFGAGKKTKLAGQSQPNRAACQVEGCEADLSKAKDYHRRHKVCEFHSKATKALVANQMQRFCQQCSRFHSLQEFDEGKRSCRRRLAGHNKRRRKAQPESVHNTSGGVVNDNQASGYLLMTVLKILSNMHSNKSNHTDGQDLLSHLLQSLASQGPQNIANNLNLLGNSELVATLLSNGSLGKRNCPNELPRKDEELQVVTPERPNLMLPAQTSSQVYSEERDTSGGRNKLNDFDLNDVYVDSDDGMDETERSTGPLDLGTVSVECPSWVQQDSHQSSPPQTSGNSDSASQQSPSSSNGDPQSRTDRIVFKLFGKEPSDFPIVLRAQIFDWLAHSPTDIESYIRPGCVVLTMYLRQSESAWEELCCELRTSLSRLLDFCDDHTFWSTGWIYIRVPNQMAFVYNGQLVVDASLPFRNDSSCTLLSVKPIAVPSSGGAQFVVKGFNLVRPSTRLLFAIEGNYLEATSQTVEPADDPEGHGVQCLNFSCSIPATYGRGFIEVDDGLSNSFFPFIVAEDDVCTEIRMLENEIDSTETDKLQQRGRPGARNQAMEFIHELGWLLHKFQSRSRFEHGDPNLAFFSFERFKHLIEFSMDRDWCAVVKKLLDILFQGIVSGGEQPFLKFALSDIGLLHRAVRRNSKSLVAMLLKYVPEKVIDELSLEYRSLVETEQSFLFRPDFVGPGGLTPLHVAAGRDGSDEILDVLIDDPGKVGIAAWKNARDSTGFTPEDYARLRGHYSYIHLVQRKMNKRLTSSGHVIVDISEPYSDISLNEKPDRGSISTFQITRSKLARTSQPCGACDMKLAYRAGRRTLVYKPVMLSMLAIAAVCVCVALLFKSSPQVLFVFRPFSWEMLEYGSY